MTRCEHDTPDWASTAQMEAKAGRLLVESARVRAARLGPDDAHELRHLWAAINAGNSDPCGENGESCHLDAEAIRRWTEQYPKVMGLPLGDLGQLAGTHPDPIRPPETDEEPSCCELACYEDPGCRCAGCVVPAPPRAGWCVVAAVFVIVAVAVALRLTGRLG